MKFRYAAYDPHALEVRGEVEAEDAEQARTQICAQGLFPILIIEVKVLKVVASATPWWRRWLLWLGV